MVIVVLKWSCISTGKFPKGRAFHGFADDFLMVLPHREDHFGRRLAASNSPIPVTNS
jgi:hypothetical protein